MFSRKHLWCLPANTYSDLKKHLGCLLAFCLTTTQDGRLEVGILALHIVDNITLHVYLHLLLPRLLPYALACADGVVVWVDGKRLPGGVET